MTFSENTSHVIRRCASFTLILVMAANPGWLSAQEEDSAPEQAAKSPEPEKKGPITETERINRLREIIKLDNEKLEQTKKEYSEQQAFLDKLNEHISKADSELKEKLARLEEIGGEPAEDGTTPEAVPEEVSVLQTEIEVLEQKLSVAKNELELRFNSSKTVQSQIQALERKIGNDERALETLLNPTLAVPETTSQKASATSAPDAAQSAPAAPSATQMMVPGAVPAQTAPAHHLSRAHSAAAQGRNRDLQPGGRRDLQSHPLRHRLVCRSVRHCR